MRHILFAALVAVSLPACKSRAEEMTLGQFRVALREQGLDDTYNGAAETPLSMNRALWITALHGQDPIAAEDVTFFRREPVWEDAWWSQITTGLDSSLVRTGWRPLSPEVSREEYVRSWERGQQRLTIGRFDLYSDSTSYVTAVLTGPRAE